MSKRIGILTSGGDCAGLNAVIRGAVHHATKLGWDIFGINDGTHGLLSRPVQHEKLSPSLFDGNLLKRGGTILGTTNKGNPFAWPMPDGSTKDRTEEILEGIELLNLDAIIGIGGDGSFAILRKLAEQGGFNMVGVPKTIDNDLGRTEVSVGFDTAVSVATEAIDRLQPTAASHDRIMILEVMGRDAGHIALNSGIAGGADIILIPEIPYKLDILAEKITQTAKDGRNFALVVVSEAVKTEKGEKAQITYADGQKRYGGIGHYLAGELMKRTGAEARVTVLGHVQRGAAPTHMDRLIATAFGVHAVELIKQEKYDRMVSWQNRSVTDVPITEAIESYQEVNTDSALVKTARAMSISLGDE